MWNHILVTISLLFFLPMNLVGQDSETTARESRDFILTPKLVDCSALRMGQFRCNETIDPATQQLRGCTNNNIAKLSCEAVEGLVCDESNNRTFTKDFECKWTNGYKYDTALLLSVFLGFLGADRFYLGHVGMGALKFCTLGFFFIGHLVDVILIATQYTTPIDGSQFIVGYYGPSVENIKSDNLTFVVRRPDWF